MRIAIAASIATDHLMSFDGKFSDNIVADQLEQISLSFLVDELNVRRGGIAANICFSMGQLGLTPLLVGSVGADFADYRQWLEQHGVNTSEVRVSDTRHTARFVATTDRELNQIASFYPGAMQEARHMSIVEVAERAGGLDLVLIGANDPEGMLRHSAECREKSIPFAADPSQQAALMGGEQLKQLIEGATYMFTNEYEAGLIEQKTGWSGSDIVARVGTRVTTLGGSGVRIERSGEEPLHIAGAKLVGEQGDPTGVGDGFRAGFLAGLTWQLPAERCAQLGNAVAVHVLETQAPQDHTLTKDSLLRRLDESYGDDAAAAVEPHL